MKLAAIMPLLLLCTPAAANAQAVQGQEALEMKCVYAAMSEAERASMARIDSGAGTPGEVDAANDLIYGYAEDCAARHGWSAEQTLAGGGFAMARSIYEGTLAALPASLSAEALDGVAAKLSDDDRYRFTSTGRAELAPDPGWSARVDAALAAAGVAPADRGAAVHYLAVLHDAIYAMQVFDELWLAKHR